MVFTMWIADTTVRNSQEAFAPYWSGSMISVTRKSRDKMPIAVVKYDKSIGI